MIKNRCCLPTSNIQIQSGWYSTAFKSSQLTLTEGSNPYSPWGHHEVRWRRGVEKEIKITHNTPDTLQKHYRGWAEGAYELKEKEKACRMPSSGPDSVIAVISSQ